MPPGGFEEWMEGNLKRNYRSLTPGLCLEDNELVGKFKMVAGDKVSIRGQVMEYMYISIRIKRRLSEVNARAVSRGQNELVCKFKMVAGDKVSIRGQLMEYK